MSNGWQKTGYFSPDGAEKVTIAPRLLFAPVRGNTRRFLGVPQGKEVGKKIISFPSSIRLGGEKRTSDPIIRERQDGLTQRTRSRMMLTPSRVGQGIAASAVDYRFEGCKGLGPTRAI
ncbi:hypothetical protein CEXT_263741 [Caerostris extrusa]|uniref:Uncharacterized protein n=1 Tax=Caerostris extrusa TaxID=172846 RepID=A0AAV4Q4E2_CAEEX|nr:hypothetical protein CEXT_263741 [Caerostris extrusa]